MKTKLLASLCLFTLFVNAQIVPSSIATWKNNASGAYSIIHDDYGDTGVDGIWKYADTIASNRGLKFTFGAITSRCSASRSINGYSSPYEYAKEVMIKEHGHEIINHSHDHSCALNSGWSPCGFTGWGELPGSLGWVNNLETSTNSIEENTGYYPRYYIYPYDVFTDDANAELEALGFIGSRTGWANFGQHEPYHRYGYNLNDEPDFFPNTNGFFRTAVQVFGAAEQMFPLDMKRDFLNASIDDAIANNQWVNRELHNVGTTGWGSVEEQPYREHLDYVQQRVETGEIWMATISEVLTYQYQKLKVTPAAIYNSSNQSILLGFDSDDLTYTVPLDEYLDSLQIKTSLTVILDVSDYKEEIDFSKVKIVQNETEIDDYSLEGDNLLINVYPHEGSVEISERNTESTVVPEEIKFEFYPSPATTQVNILGGRVWDIKVLDVNGKVVLTGNKNQLNISNLSSGVYFAQINDYKTPQKFVKK